MEMESGAMFLAFSILTRVTVPLKDTEQKRDFSHLSGTVPQRAACFVYFGMS